MIFNIELELEDYYGEAIIAEAKERNVAPEEIIEEYILENDILIDDHWLDFLGDLMDKHGIDYDFD